MLSVLPVNTRELLLFALLWVILDYAANYGIVHATAGAVNIFQATRQRAWLATLGATFVPAALVALIWSLFTATLSGTVLGVLLGAALATPIIRLVYGANWTQAALVALASLLGHAATAVLALFLAAAVRSVVIA